MLRRVVRENHWRRDLGKRTARHRIPWEICCRIRRYGDDTTLLALRTTGRTIRLVSPNVLFFLFWHALDPSLKVIITGYGNACG